MVGARDLPVREFVQAGGEPLGGPPVVDEHDRRAVRADQLEQDRMDRRPDRGTVNAPLGRVARSRELGHVVDGHDHLELELFAHAGVDDRHVALPAELREPAQEPGDLVERALRGRQPDPLDRPAGLGFQSLERQHQVCTAFGRGDRMDLVQDDRVDPAQRFPGRRGQHEVQGLRRRDQDVGRLTEQPAALARVGVAGAHTHRGQVGKGFAAVLGGPLDAGERRPEVLLDVDRQRSQGRDVQDPGTALGLRRGVRREPVDRPQEGRKGLARAGRRQDQGVVTCGDRRPGAPLGVGGRVERSFEPTLRGWGEGREVHG